MSSPLEADSIVIPLIDGYTIIDLACGWGKWGSLIRTNWFCTAVGEGETQPDYLLGVDIFLPTLTRVKNHKIYDDVINCDISALPIRDNSLDVVIASEVIEHLQVPKGLELLNESERISKKTIILITPIYPGKRGAALLPEGLNPYEQHVTRWGIGFLKSMGYTVMGIGPPVYVHRALKQRGIDKSRIFPLVQFISLMISAISYIIPYLGWEIVAKKHITRKKL